MASHAPATLYKEEGELERLSFPFYLIRDTAWIGSGKKEMAERAKSIGCCK